MFQLRIHGRGGQGVVTAAELASVAAFQEGAYAQAFPSFGSERMGAPVVAFCRISRRPIRLREPVLEPDALIIQDPTLLHQVDVFEGADRVQIVLINTTRTLSELGLEDFVRQHPEAVIATVPATELAREHVGRPSPNTALLGGFVALTERISLQALCAAIREKFPGPVGENNVRAAEAAHRLVQSRTRAGARS